MIKPIAAKPTIIIKKAEKPVVQFFSKSPSPFSTAEKGETTKSAILISTAVVASTLYLYKKYRRAKMAKGEALNPTIDNNALKLNKKINRLAYNSSKFLKKKGLDFIANMFRGLIFKI